MERRKFFLGFFLLYIRGMKLRRVGPLEYSRFCLVWCLLGQYTRSATVRASLVCVYTFMYEVS